MFTRSLIEQCTRLSERDIQYVMRVCLGRTAKGPLTAGEALAVLIYDLLKQMGFSTEDLTSLLIHLRERVLELGKAYETARPGDKVPITTLQILDNQWVCLSGDKEVYDFRKMASVPRIPAPVLSLAVALPALYRRALEAARPLPGRPPAAAARPSRPAGGEAGP